MVSNIFYKKYPCILVFDSSCRGIFCSITYKILRVHKSHLQTNFSFNLQPRNLLGTKINLPQHILQSRNLFRY